MDQLYCRNDTCRHILAGSVNFCPFCGAPQQAVIQPIVIPSVEVFTETEAEAKLLAESRSSIPEMPPVNVILPVEAPEKPVETPVEKNSANAQQLSVQQFSVIGASRVEAVPLMALEENWEEECIDETETETDTENDTGSRSWLSIIWRVLRYGLALIIGVPFLMFLVFLVYYLFFFDRDVESLGRKEESTIAAAVVVDDKSINNSDSHVSERVDGTIPLTITTNLRLGQDRIRVMNIVPVYYNGIPLPPGRYDIEVSAPGYQTERRWIRLTAQERSFRFELEPAGRREPALGLGYMISNKKLKG